MLSDSSVVSGNPIGMRNTEYFPCPIDGNEKIAEKRARMAGFKFVEATPMNSEKTAKNIESSANAMMRAIVDILTPRPDRPCAAGGKAVSGARVFHC
ncbi:hypothetical protein KDW69_03490 [Burkholderia ambifaria]|uniref:hypothetical protein n=1 Tax=Burkholderia ambifaria TaxID=152480 RepID=UPI001B9B7853|nr:hypothetical protein [Burkholderia ambifaria]MBR8330708.1 hypothetical protein [Burkholderia ambifaria]